MCLLPTVSSYRMKASEDASDNYAHSYRYSKYNFKHRLNGESENGISWYVTTKPTDIIVKRAHNTHDRHLNYNDAITVVT